MAKKATRKVSPEATAAEALGRAVCDPTPRPLHGTKAKPGIFIGSTAPMKAASQLCVERGWV